MEDHDGWQWHTNGTMFTSARFDVHFLINCIDVFTSTFSIITCF